MNSTPTELPEMPPEVFPCSSLGRVEPGWWPPAQTPWSASLAQRESPEGQSEPTGTTNTHPGDTHGNHMAGCSVKLLVNPEFDFFLFLIGVQLLYNTVLVSAVQ